MSVCRENFQHALKLQKRYHNKHAKLRSYATGKKVWLNSKYIKTKQNCKLDAKFFGSFRVLHSVRSKPTSWNYWRSVRSTMFFTCQCWSRTPQGSGERTKRCLSWSSRATAMATARNMKLRRFARARSMPVSLKVICEADQPRPLALTNELKTGELSIFILFSTLSLPKKKNSSPHVMTESPHPVWFYFQIFLLKHLPGQKVFSTNAFSYCQLALPQRIPRG